MDEVTIQLKYLAMKANPGTIIYWAGHYAPFVGECAQRAIEEPDFLTKNCATPRPDGNYIDIEDGVRYPIIAQYDTEVIHPCPMKPAHHYKPGLAHWSCYGCHKRFADHG